METCGNCSEVKKALEPLNQKVANQIPIQFLKAIYQTCARLAIVSNAKRGKIKIELPLRTKARILDVSVRSEHDYNANESIENNRKYVHKS